MTLRVGIDVGGTFTKAVAVETSPFSLLARAHVPTTHEATDGVTEGVAAALAALLSELGRDSRRVGFVAFSTTQAMNALLEGDVAKVGVVGIGSDPDLRLARKRTRVGEVGLAPGRALATAHAFVDATVGIDDGAVETVLDQLATVGCGAIAVSGAFGVDSPEQELRVAELARRRGLPACCGSDLTGAYGLETRTISAAINASILPVVERTAGLVERALSEAGIEVPLLVLRGDGGAMGVEAFRRRPSFTVGSGPAAGVAAALHQVGVGEAIVMECGGTSSNVSVVKGGRPVLRSIRVMGRPTAIRSIDSWVVGAAGGSMPRLGRRRIAEVGPRSAHAAGFGYAAFSGGPARDAELNLVAPQPEDPPRYAVASDGGENLALTATCAANALGIVSEGSFASGDRANALRAFQLLGERLRTSAEAAARAVLDGAVSKIVEAVEEAARHHDLGDDAPLVALGGAADALAPEVARLTGRELRRPEHAEVLSSIGAALSLVRTEVARAPFALSGAGSTEATRRPQSAARLALAHEAERACVAEGAAPQTVAVESIYDADAGVIRAVATGALALETGAADRRPLGTPERMCAAASALGVDADRLQMVAANDFYSVYSENGSGRVAVVDRHGAVPLAEDARRVLTGEGPRFVSELAAEIDANLINLGVASLLPRVSVLCGARLLDLSDARQAKEVVSAAERLVVEQDGLAVAVLSR